MASSKHRCQGHLGVPGAQTPGLRNLRNGFSLLRRCGVLIPTIKPFVPNTVIKTQLAL